MPRLSALPKHLCAAIAVASIYATPAVAAPPVQTGPEVTPAQHDFLPSLRGVQARPDELLPGGGNGHPAHPLPSLDGPGQPDDPVVQSSASIAVAVTPGAGFDGVGVGFTGPQGSFTPDSAPPDTNASVGATQVVQIVNEAFAVFDKATHAVIMGPVPTRNLWAGFPGPCSTDNDGDAVAVYDKAANRWVISQFAVTAAPYFQCVAVSTTNDATGAYNRYSFPYGNVFPDYPKIGVWPDAYYITFNMFTNTFQGAKLCAYDRAKMLAGQPATQQCFQLSTSFGGVLPADLDGSTQPPAGSPNYLVAKGTNVLDLWRFHVDWVNTASTTLTGPIVIPVAAYTSACNGGTCIPQSGTNQQLDSLADRLMYRLAYRNIAGVERLVVNHSVRVGTSNRNPFTGVRWYEIRNPNGSPSIFQQSTFSPDSSYRWMGSIAMDKLGNMAMGYSVSSSAMHPAIRFTGRLASDPLGTMQAETSIIEGTGSQLRSLSRWGDYSSMAIDPVDDCTFWFTTEYLKANGTFNWSTRIASFKFPGCI
ncbi:MAG TPA: hypothetical protein VNU21_18835 [Usitatibacter sp.]|nr:hypothetical protein [Usitatibacter sp.]